MLQVMLAAHEDINDVKLLKFAREGIFWYILDDLITGRAPHRSGSSRVLSASA